MTIEADSANSSLNTVSIIGPVSPLKPYTYYNKAIRGCGKKCPCRVWAQCGHYVDITEQQMRLKRKSNKILEEIHTWYEDNFRLKYEYCDIFGNG